MKKMVIGIASQQAIRARALAIAHGDHQPRCNNCDVFAPVTPAFFPA